MLKLGYWWFNPANVIEIEGHHIYCKFLDEVRMHIITEEELVILNFYLDTFGPGLGYRDLNKLYDDRENILKMMEAAKKNGTKS